MPQIIRELFETELENFLQVPNAFAVNSGTSALIAALWSLDLKPGDEVITTPFTFISTTNAIVISQGTPIFVDIDEDDHLIDSNLIEAAITERTKAILPVHLFGRSCNMSKILQIAEKYNLYVIEDAAQSFGLLHENKLAGTRGDVGCFSFYKTKNFSTFEGGAIAIPSHSKINPNKIRAIIDPGVNRNEGLYYGFNFRMPEPCALIGYEKLKLHRPQIATELGRYAEKDGFYKKLIYDYPAFHQYKSHCPVAESLVKDINGTSI